MKLSLFQNGNQAVFMGIFLLWAPILQNFLSNWGFFVSAAFWRSCNETEKCDCSGTDFLLSRTSSANGLERINYLRRIYENCTRVHANLEITYLQQKDLDDYGQGALDFLENIEEVMGSVIIHSNRIENLSIPRLRIIWGDKLIQEFYHGENVLNSSGSYSLHIVENNFDLLDLRSLTAVHKGNIFIHHNKKMCHWKTLDFRQVLGDNYKDRLHMSQNFEQCKEDDSDCFGNCTKCFGPFYDQCQKVYRDDCALQCTSGTCFNVSLPQYCCHPECIGGCYGPMDNQCFGCRHMRHENRCVEKCPSRERYNPSAAQYEPNPDGTYALARHCVKECPEHMAIYKEGCVARCPSSHIVNPQTRMCVPCGNSCATKSCSINESVSESNLHLFAGCTRVEGFIQIAGFSNASEDFEIMSNIEEVTDYVFIERIPIFSLHFLRNLRKIQGRRLYKAAFSLYIRETSLKTLDLVNLKRIGNGDIYIGHNYFLCHADSINWRHLGGSRYGFKIWLEQNRAQNVCLMEDRQCHNFCVKYLGCWGTGADKCFECETWSLNGSCVAECDSRSGVFEKAKGICQHCHAECLNCTGETARDCVECKHVRQDGECVLQCDTQTRYLDAETNNCEPCHKNCFSFGCTGPNNLVGPGGCNKCKFGILGDDRSNITRCLSSMSLTTCTEVTGSENYYWNAPGVLVHKIEHAMCARCDPVCRKCTQYGHEIESHGCVCAFTKIYRRPPGKEECVQACPTTYFVEAIGSDQVEQCKPCHPTCLDDCFGSGPEHCNKCKDFTVPFENGTKVCVQKCPPALKFVRANKICSDVEDDAISIARRRTNTITMIICLAVAALLIATTIVACITCFNAKMLEKLAIPDDQYEMNPAAKPDLSQLKIIRETELKLSDVLGFGAFGTVHKGIWFTIDRDNRRLKVPVAIKVLHEANPSAQQELVEEAGHMARVSHPYLVRLTGLCLGKQLMLVTPLMPLGSLLDYVHNNRAKIGSSALLRWCSQIASGMAHLEENRLVHRDLAARNVLVQNPYHVRITDFGLAKMLDYGQQELEVSEGKLPVKWLALESIKQLRFTHKSDVWAFGVTVWELLTFGDKPYKDIPMSEILNVLEKGERLQQPNICTLDVYMLMIKCWMVDPECRPSFVDLRESFNRMAKDPGRYLVIEGDRLLRLPSYSSRDHREMVRRLIDDPDLCDPDDYLDSYDSTASIPGSPAPSLSPLSEDVENYPTVTNNVSRSPGSIRYAADPLQGKSILATDLDNYLMPDSVVKNQQHHLVNNLPLSQYTPILQNSESFSEARPHIYYNEPQTKIRKTRSEESLQQQDLNLLEHVTEYTECLLPVTMELHNYNSGCKVTNSSKPGEKTSSYSRFSKSSLKKWLKDNNNYDAQQNSMTSQDFIDGRESTL